MRSVRPPRVIVGVVASLSLAVLPLLGGCGGGSADTPAGAGGAGGKAGGQGGSAVAGAGGSGGSGGGGSGPVGSGGHAGGGGSAGNGSGGSGGSAGRGGSAAGSSGSAGSGGSAGAVGVGGRAGAGGKGGAGGAATSAMCGTVGPASNTLTFTANGQTIDLSDATVLLQPLEGGIYGAELRKGTLTLSLMLQYDVLADCPKVSALPVAGPNVVDWGADGGSAVYRLFLEGASGTFSLLGADLSRSPAKFNGVAFSCVNCVLTGMRLLSTDGGAVDNAVLNGEAHLTGAP